MLTNKTLKNPLTTINQDEQDDLKNLTKHKEYAVRADLTSKYSEFDYKKAQRVGACGSYLFFSRYENLETAEIKRFLNSSNFCDLRFCPMCSWLKVYKTANNIKSVLQQIQATRSVEFIFLTLTLKNVPLTQLRSTLAIMSAAFNRMKGAPAFTKAVLGYIRSVEFLGDNTKEGEAHPHFHTLLVVPKYYFTSPLYISKDKWAQMWQKALRVDYLPIVDVRKIKPKKEYFLADGSKLPQEQAAIISVAVELVKYEIKPLQIQGMKSNDFQILDQETKGIRHYNKGGLIKEIAPLEAEPIDLEVWRELAPECYRWIKGAYAKTEKSTDIYTHD